MNFSLLRKNIGKNLSNEYGQKLLDSAKRSPKKLQNDEMEAPKKRYISSKERQQIVDELRLV